MNPVRHAWLWFSLVSGSVLMGIGAGVLFNWSGFPYSIQLVASLLTGVVAVIILDEGYNLTGKKVRR